MLSARLSFVQGVHSAGSAEQGVEPQKRTATTQLSVNEGAMNNPLHLYQSLTALQGPCDGCNIVNDGLGAFWNKA